MKDGLSSLSLFPWHYFVFSLSDVTLFSSEMPSFVLFLLSSEVKMRNKRVMGGSLEAGVLTSSPLPPFVPSFPPSDSISALHLSVFLSDSWQPVGYSGHASTPLLAPRCIHLPTDLRKHILVRNALLYLGVLISRSSHYCPRSMAAIKTCNSTSTANESNGTHLRMRPHHKTNHLRWGPFSWSLKNNYMWTDSNFWWTFPIR